MSLVKSFTHLKGRPNEERALPQLQRIASLLKPIMRKHNWSLPILAEFFPSNDALVGLNVNAGQKILLRLRPAWAPDTFYDEEQLVLVMLHELTHNVHGPHDSKFYILLSQLEQEYGDLKRTGYAGEGFHSPGARVGVGVSHDLPPHLARLKALDAAERRRKAAAVMSGGGRLGGSTVGRRRSPRELAAEAAERRAKDEKSCGSGHGIDAEVEVQRAVRDSVVDVIDVDSIEDPALRANREPSHELVLDDSPQQARKGTRERPPEKPVVAPSSTSSSNQGAHPSVTTSEPHPTPRSGHKFVLRSTDHWSCPTCTFLNMPLALQCSACFSTRPPDSNTGWACLACGEQDMPHDFWTCRFCGWVKNES